MAVWGLGVEAGADAHAIKHVQDQRYHLRLSTPRIPATLLPLTSGHASVAPLFSLPASATAPTVGTDGMCTAAAAPMQAVATVQRPWDGGSVRGASTSSSALFDLDLEVCCSFLHDCWAALSLQADRRVCDATYI